MGVKSDNRVTLAAWLRKSVRVVLPSVLLTQAWRIIDRLDHALERADVGIRDLVALGDVAHRAEVLGEVIGQLVLGGLGPGAPE